MPKFFLFFLVLFSTSAICKDVSIDMLNVRSDGQSMVYSIDVAKIEIGDTVTWIPKDKGHNVEFILGPNAVELPKKSRINKEFSFTFEKTGIYFYQCTPHKSMGMIAMVIVGNDLSNLEDIKKIRVFGKSKRKLDQILSMI
ncbi:MAG: plastocyanin/azurin family copper-binding protein [Pseudomonadota bacterium]|nr:plastocyanin/azurin family copper-binding protein [Pseudomonadota bacterium]